MCVWGGLEVRAIEMSILSRYAIPVTPARNTHCFDWDPFGLQMYLTFDPIRACAPKQSLWSDPVSDKCQASLIFMAYSHREKHARERE